MVEVKDLRKQYNPPEGVTAVQGVSFAIRQGEIFSLLGPNGAGKSTTISMLSCLLTPTSGDAIIDGHSITNDAKAVKQVIGVVPQEIALYDTISARENLMFWGKMYGLSGEKLKERVAEVLKIAGLTDRAEEKVATFSGGMKRRINIAVGLLHNPKVLYMDEPTVGIDPQSRRRILDTVKELNDQGLTVLYTTHYMEEAEELSDRIGIIDHGQLIAVGTQDELTDMVGQYDTVRLDVGETTEVNGTLVSDIAALAGVHQVHGEGEQVIVQAEDANVVLPRLLQTVAEHGRSIRRMEIQEPNLEAVFLHLTGRALRD
ncbi:MAG: ABC transporter ATP-binding protein [Ardenticatenaceae bacterium]|nr:ABC transporter ATP-binding protein [Ardenticatenaceae bacterium]